MRRTYLAASLATALFGLLTLTRSARADSATLTTPDTFGMSPYTVTYTVNVAFSSPKTDCTGSEVYFRTQYDPPGQWTSGGSDVNTQTSSPAYYFIAIMYTVSWPYTATVTAQSISLGDAL